MERAIPRRNQPRFEKPPEPSLFDASDEDPAKPAPVEAEVEEEEEEVASTDPVRAYLSRIGAVSLLTREGEIEIAKRIEQGERLLLGAVIGSPIGIEHLLALPERLKNR